MVVLKDRGQSLRFYHANQVRLNSTIMRDFLKDEAWKSTQPWSSPLAPGGSRCVLKSSSPILLKLMRVSSEFILHYFAVAMLKIYAVTVRVPKFILMIATGALGSLIMGLLHRGNKEEAAKPAAETPPAIKAASHATTTPTSSPAKKGSVKGKKGGKGR